MFQTAVPGSGQLPLNYTEATYHQVDVLVARSVYCRQTIEVYCNDSALLLSPGMLGALQS